MADIADEAGKELYDLLLRYGQDASKAAVVKCTEGLASGLKNVKERIEASIEKSCEGLGLYEMALGTEGSHWRDVKFSLAELAENPCFDHLKQSLHEGFAEAAIEHAFVEVDGREHIQFNGRYAPEAVEIFNTCLDEFSSEAKKAEVKIDEELSVKRDAEPLQLKVMRAKSAAQISVQNHDRVRQAPQLEVKAR